MTKRFYIFFLLALLSLSSCKKRRFTTPVPALSKDAFAVVFLSSLEGYVVPCGCTSNPLGGIDRFAQVFLDIKKALSGRIALIDTGNLLFDSSSRHPADMCEDNARLDLLLTTLKNLGLKKTFTRGFDNARGDDFRSKLYEKFGLSSLDNQKSYIINTGDFDIAIITIRPKTTRPDLINLTSELKAQKRIKAIIALSELDKEESKIVVKNLNIDVVIDAKTSSMTPSTPFRLGSDGPLFVDGGRQGQFATVLFFQNVSTRNDLSLELDNRQNMLTQQLELVQARLSALKTQKEKAPDSRKDFLSQRIKVAQEELGALENQKKQATKALTTPHIIFDAIALTKKVDPLPEAKKQLDAYEKSIPALVVQCEAQIQCPSVSAQDPTYVGVQTCKSCHAQAYEVWQKAVFTNTGLNEEGKEFKRQIGHSTAWATLSDINKDQDRSCVGCHSIGFMKPGGYCKTSDVDFRKDVQCESCHGPGSLHAQSGDKKFINRQVGEETCRGCHHVPHIQNYDSFNYDRDRMKILGPGHGENLLKELKHKAAQNK